MIINHNLNAMNAHRQLGFNTVNAGKSMEKLSSGLRINRAGDDAAGLAISEKMRAQIRGLEQASRNSQDGISLIQTAEGALNETHSMLQRMRELVIQANNGTNNDDDLSAIQKEIGELKTEITDLANRTEFNTKKLLNGSFGVKVKSTSGATGLTNNTNVTIDVSAAKSGETFTIGVDATNNTITLTDSKGNSQSIVVTDETKVSGTLDFKALGVKITSSTEVNWSGGTIDGQNIITEGNSAVIQIGANSSQDLTLQFNDMRATALGTSTGNRVSDIDVTNASQSFATRLQIVDDAIKQVSSERAKMGAYQNRLEHTIANLNTSSENLTAAESRVRDVDMAKEMMAFSKNNILAQAAQAMLAQANQQPQGVLQLLR